MQTSGKPYEGWMTFIPLTIFILFVISFMGGPLGFMNVLANWVTDVSGYIVNWIRSF